MALHAGEVSLLSRLPRDRVDLLCYTPHRGQVYLEIALCCGQARYRLQMMLRTDLFGCGLLTLRSRSEAHTVAS